MRTSENKDTYLAQQKKPFHCECGSTWVWNARATHFRTQKHQESLKQQEAEIEPHLEESDLKIISCYQYDF